MGPMDPMMQAAGGAPQMCPCCGRPMDAGMPMGGGMPMPDNMAGAPNVPLPGGMSQEGEQLDPMLVQMILSGGMPGGGMPPPPPGY